MSSLSMNKVRGRALNANTQNTNNFSMWMEPLSHKDYPLTYVVNPTNNALITSNGVKNVVIAQPGLTYNNVRLDVSGSVNPTRWTTGQTINTVFLESADMAQINTAISAGTVATYTYTPKSANSKIIVEYGGLYNISGDSGAGLDAFESQVTVDSTLIAKRQQQFPNAAGSGTRGSTIFPICGGIANAALTPRVINITLSRISGDDTVQFFSASFAAFMKITEISL
jgi:hypothetical protein